MKVIKTASYQKLSQFSGDENYGDDITSGIFDQPSHSPAFPPRSHKKVNKEMCHVCKQLKPDVEKQYSYGVYAGTMCKDCAINGFRDHCGHTGHMGTEQEWNELGDVPYNPE